MSSITEKFPAYTGLALSRSLSQEDFDDAEEYFQGYHAPFVPIINNWATQANVLGEEINANALLTLESAQIAKSAANYQGIWTAKGYDVGQSVKGSDGTLYQCDVTHATEQDPTSTTGYWSVNVPVGVVGDINSPLFSLQAKNSFNIRSGVGSVVSTRTTTGTIADRYGTLITKAVDEPRFNKKGHLSECQSENITLRSQIDNTWITQGTNFSVDFNNYPGIDGSNNASKATKGVEDAGSEEVYKVLPVANGITYTDSVWLKGEVGGEAVKISAQLDGGDYHSFASSIILTTEYVKYDLTWTCDNDTYGWRQSIQALSENSSFYMEKAQREDGLFATSYIPTTDAPATRAGDITSIDTYDNMPNLKDGFTLFWEGTPVFEEPNTTQYIFYNHTDASNEVRLYVLADGIRALFRKAGVYMFIETPVFSDEKLKVAVVGDENGIVKMFINNILIDTVDMSSIIDMPLADLTYIGSSNGVPNTNSIIHTENFETWDFPLSNTAIALL